MNVAAIAHKKTRQNSGRFASNDSCALLANVSITARVSGTTKSNTTIAIAIPTDLRIAALPRGEQ